MTRASPVPFVSVYSSGIWKTVFIDAAGSVPAFLSPTKSIAAGKNIRNIPGAPVLKYI
jgi:hypothetical protein